MAQINSYSYGSDFADQVRRLVGASEDGVVNVMDPRFGAVGDGTTDDTAAIQAAIDYAYTNQIRAIFLPEKAFKTTLPIFLDPPANLRGSAAAWSSGTTYALNDTVTYLGVRWRSIQNSNTNHTPAVGVVGSPNAWWELSVATPSIFGFSFHLFGLGGANHESFGARIKPASNMFPAVWLGPGQGNVLHGVSIVPATSGTTTAAHSTNGVGVAIAGGSGGASRTLVENVWVEQYYNGFLAGANGVDALADSNTLRKCMAQGCYYGYHFSKTQNYINELLGCSAEACKISVYSPVGKAVKVEGGNFSHTNGKQNKFSISSVSALSSFLESKNGSGSTNYTFTAVVSSPDTPMVNGDYDRFCVDVDGFGVVPMRKTAYDSGTSTITLKFDVDWIRENWGYSATIATATDIEAKVQAATSLFAAEQIIVFLGSGIHARETHIENYISLTQVARAEAGFAGDSQVSLENLNLNWDPTFPTLKANATYEAVFKCQQVFPFIEAASVPVVVRGGQWGQSSSSERLFMRAINQEELVFSDLFETMTPPNIGLASNVGAINGSGYSYSSRARGVGRWDTAVVPFGVDGWGSTTDYAWRSATDGRAPYFGNRPASFVMPQITPAHLTTLSGSLSGVGLGTYPLMYGQTAYRVCDWDTGAVTSKLFAVSDHEFWTYGKDLTIDWSYLGQSTVLAVSGTDVDWLFCGLKIGIDNGGGVAWYIITGVYPALGYVTVCSELDSSTPGPLAGTKTTTYTGATISQQPFSITQY